MVDPRSFGARASAPGARTIADDLIEALARETGLPLRLELAPSSVALERVRSGGADVMGLYPLTLTQPPFKPSVQVGEGSLRAYALDRNVSALDKPLRSPHHRVAVVAGLYPATWLRTMHPSIKQVPARDFSDAIRLLRSGEADLLLALELATRISAYELSVDDSLIEGPVLASVPFGFMVHGRNPQLLARLDAGIQSLRDKGRLDAIRRRWEPGPLVTLKEFRLRQWALGGAAVAGVAVLISLCAALVLWRRSSRLARERGKLLADMQWSLALEGQTFDASPTPMSISRASDLSLVRVNDAYVRAFGWEREELLAMRGSAKPWANPGEREELIGQALRNGFSEARVTRVRDARGRTIWMRVAYQRLEVAGEVFVLATVTDITAIETQRREYEVMLAKVPVGILVYEADRIVLANPEIERLLGWAPGTAIGRRAADLWRDDTEREWAKSYFAERLRTTDVVAYEHEIGGSTGRRFFARGVAVSISSPSDPKLRTLWTCVDASEEVRVSREREAARRAAEAANDAKSRFLANISHEIRTPLHALINLHEMLSLSGLAPAQAELLHKADHAGRTLMGLVSDVLDFSKIEAGALVLEAAPFGLDSLVQGLEAVLHGHARAPGVALRVLRLCHGPVTLVGDVTRLRQVLINLGTNALKFTAQGEVVVQIGCEPVPGDTPRVRLSASVRDTGIGMDAVTQAALFTPFLQADSSITRRYGGTGLGLAISQSIVRAMGGEIAVQSSPGAGSEFSFTVELPMAAMGSAPARVAPAGDAQGEAGVDGVDGDAARATRPGALAGLRALVVDDNELNRFVLRRMLEDEGAKVGEADDGRAALQWLAAAPQATDLVLMDLQMPEMDGVTAMRAMRADARWRQVPVLIVSGDVTVDQRDAALAAGARAFLSKPMMRDQLLAQVALLGIAPRGEAAEDPPVADAAPAARPLPPADDAAPWVPELDALDALLLSVAINELDWGRSTIAALAAAAPADAARLAQAAHRIKGTAKQLGCEPLTAAAMALEQACKRDPQARRGAWPVQELLRWIESVHALLAARMEAQTQTQADAGTTTAR